MERSEKPTRKGRIENDEHDAGQRVGGGGEDRKKKKEEEGEKSARGAWNHHQA